MNKETLKTEEQRGMRPRSFARVYGIGEATVYKMLKEGKLPAVLINGRYLILNKQFEEMVDAGDLHLDGRDVITDRTTNSVVVHEAK